MITGCMVQGCALSTNCVYDRRRAASPTGVVLYLCPTHHRDVQVHPSRYELSVDEGSRPILIQVH